MCELRSAQARQCSGLLVVILATCVDVRNRRALALGKQGGEALQFADNRKSGRLELSEICVGQTLQSKQGPSPGISIGVESETTERCRLKMSQPKHRVQAESGANADSHALFLRLYTRHQHRIMAYIFTLVANRADAEDLLQETAVVLWEKFDSFQPGTDFVAWACRVAFLKVLNHRRRSARADLLLEDDLLEAVAGRAIELAPQLDRRREALEECMKRLSERDRRMILARYEPGGGVQRAAEASGRSLEAAYKALYRIRKALFDCVTLRIAEPSAR